MNIEHKFEVGAQVEALSPSFPREWRRGYIKELAPYRGQPGYYVNWSDRKLEEWDSSGGWQSENCVREIATSK